jgi:hypothetical protein
MRTYPSLLEHKYFKINHVSENTEALFRQLVEPSHQPDICRHFGCGKILTLEERLCGNRCKDHQKVSEIDVTMFVSY